MEQTNFLLGRIIKSGKIETGVGQKGAWKRQEYILETTQDQYPKKICLTAWNKAQESFSSIEHGVEIKVFYNIESREYNEKWYTEVKPWKVEVI